MGSDRSSRESACTSGCPSAAGPTRRYKSKASTSSSQLQSGFCCPTIFETPCSLLILACWAGSSDHPARSTMNAVRSIDELSEEAGPLPDLRTSDDREPIEQPVAGLAAPLRHQSTRVACPQDHST